MNTDDKRHPRFNPKFKSIRSKDLPSGESLKMVIERIHPFWKKYLKYIRNEDGNHIIVAHSNSLRAIVKILDQLSEKEIMKVNIPTGVPLVYDLNNANNVINKKYLIDKEQLQIKQDLVKKQGKVE